MTEFNRDTETVSEGVRAGAPWSYNNLKFYGMSLSGIRTSLTMPELSLAFDVAQGYSFLLPIKTIFISHGHLDHAAGLPYLISQKTMHSQKPADYYMPPSLIEPLHKIMKLWEQIEDHTYNCRFHPAGDEEIPINPHHYVKSFPTHHRVESLGYTVFKRTKKLIERFKNATREEIIAAKNQGLNIESFTEAPLVSFSGDTKIEFLFERPWIRKSKVLFLESTYLDDNKPISKAREWGHTHLDEIIPMLKDIESEKIVLIHISSRYPTKVAQQIIFDKIPREHHERIVIFPGR